MKELEQKMVDKINKQIGITMSLFTEWNPSHERRMERIDVMIDMLTLVTGKEYIITEKELIEK
ncbi:MAG: hypothetical protein BHW64_01760 [Candidatus Melainabacteria bacterium LEY3_CP_29_8]|nr:MAG: hypothetical protein BHW64_01760 [Candidatus Melainabacteria bacterium LEY3_CP_29_8]